MKHGYTPLFSPPTEPSSTVGDAPTVGDRSALGVYVFSDEITLAVNVGLATGRPLLVRGTSGAGKTSLARALAPLLDCDFHESVVTGHTQAQDLLWTVDLLRRLQDAQLKSAVPPTGLVTSCRARCGGRSIRPAPVASSTGLRWTFPRGRSPERQRATRRAAPCC